MSLAHDIRYSEPEDLAFLEGCFEDAAVCDDYPFGVAEKADALKNWIGFARFKASLTATIGGKPCAIGTLFLMPYKKVAHHCSFQLMVAPEFRMQGVGTSMVRNLLNLAKTRFKLESVNVEVYKPSGLLPILKKLDFEVFSEQENFVKVNGTGHARVLLEHYF
jgi:RimJ/RimL family protein N-acetyltransferase